VIWSSFVLKEKRRRKMITVFIIAILGSFLIGALFKWVGVFFVCTFTLVAAIYFICRELRDWK
jgi:hypothetical protein